MTAHPLDPKDVSIVLDDLRLANDRRLASVSLAVLFLASLWFARTDLEVFASDPLLLRDRLLLRASLVSVSLIGLIVIYLARSRAIYSLALWILAWSVGAVLVATVLTRPVGSGLPLRFPLLFLTVSYFAWPNSWGRQIWPPLVTSVGLAVPRLTWLSEGGVVPEVDVVALAAVNVVGIAAVSIRLRLEAVAADAVGRLHALNEIIRVCSTCGQVHSEVAGWQPLDHYVRARSTAQFSEEICPACSPTERRV